jgi:drug/metabolite transporter superfamily protein YnfA
LVLFLRILSNILSVNEKHKDQRVEKVAIGLTGGMILFLYGIVPTLQPSLFGRT